MCNVYRGPTTDSRCGEKLVSKSKEISTRNASETKFIEGSSSCVGMDAFAVAWSAAEKLSKGGNASVNETIVNVKYSRT